MHNVTELKRNSKKGIFLGCGNSINNLTKENIDKLHKEFDIWTSNSFMINQDIKPDFYHLEIKQHRNGPLVSRITSEEYERFRNTKWILDATRPYLTSNFKLEKYKQENFYFYKKYYRQELDGKYIPRKDSLGVSLNASLSLICDAIIKQNYEEFYFLGVDMNDSKYFWTDNEKYKDREIEDIIKTCKPDERSPNEVHPTFKMKNFIKEIFETNNQKAINLSRYSLLKDVIETKKIGEVL
jgi:hypothetical protein